jgi:hypothetical protein
VYIYIYAGLSEVRKDGKCRMTERRKDTERRKILGRLMYRERSIPLFGSCTIRISAESSVDPIKTFSWFSSVPPRGALD